MSSERTVLYFDNPLDVEVVVGLSAIVHAFRGKDWPVSVALGLKQWRAYDLVGVIHKQDSNKISLYLDYFHFLGNIEKTQRAGKTGPQPLTATQLELDSIWNEGNGVAMAEAILKHHGEQTESIRVLQEDGSGINLLKLHLWRHLKTSSKTKGLLEVKEVTDFEGLFQIKSILDSQSLAYLTAFEDFREIMERFPTPPHLNIEP